MYIYEALFPPEMLYPEVNEVLKTHPLLHGTFHIFTLRPYRRQPFNLSVMAPGRILFNLSPRSRFFFILNVHDCE